MLLITYLRSSYKAYILDFTRIGSSTPVAFLGTCCRRRLAFFYCPEGLPTRRLRTPYILASDSKPERPHRPAPSSLHYSEEEMSTRDTLDDPD